MAIFRINFSDCEKIDIIMERNFTFFCGILRTSKVKFYGRFSKFIGSFLEN